MKKYFVLTSLLLVFLLQGNAQQPNPERGATYCHAKKIHGNASGLQKHYSPNSPRHSFDVLDYALSLDLSSNYTSPYPASFVASEVITFHVDSVLNSLTLNAVNSSLTIDSVRLAGVGFSHLADQLIINLDRTYNPGEEAEVKIYYRHNDIQDNAVYCSGGFFFTDCEPEGARKWFPCWDSPSDKATVDIHAKVPLAVRLGSNGRLQDSIVEAPFITYHWVSRDPVATYLVVITSRMNYLLDIVNWTNPNTSEVIPIRFYYNPGEDPSEAEGIISDMTTFYSSEFGDHPFEKNGFATLNNQFAWGGMENQTLTSFCPNCWASWLVAHEFAHQWFGDMITCATWADIFLNEGFATWTEAHWTEHVGGYGAYKNEIDGNASYYISANPHWAISDPAWAVNTPDLGTLFNYAITYMKGSCVLHQLRYVLGDSLYFAGIKAYATDTVNFKYKSATIPDFKDKLEAVTGQELDWFFNEWIYLPNHPKYNNSYSISNLGNGKWNVRFTARQVTLVNYWQMPVELNIRFLDLTDTTVRVFNSYNGEFFDFQFDKQPTGLVFDPNNDIVLKEGTTIVGTEEALSDPGEAVTVYPSPFNNEVNIRFYLNEAGGAKLTIIDQFGKQVWDSVYPTGTAGIQEMKLDTKFLASGVYFLHLQTKDYTSTVKLVKQ